MSSSWSTNVSEVVIGVVGVTGSGKSSFIKRVTQRSDILTSTDTESVTQEIAQYCFHSEGIKYVLVDTPGFDDSNRDDEDVFRELAGWMAQSFRKGQLLNGLLYVQAVNAPRQRGSQIRNLLMFKKLCGNNNFKNIVLGLSFCDMEAEATIRSRQQELTSTPEWWGEMVSKGSRIERIPYPQDDCIRLLAQFAPQRKVILKIQEEIVNQGIPVEDTEAAKTIAHRQELIQIRAIEARQFATLRAEHDIKTQQAREAYENTLRLAQQRFEIQHQRLQLQEQSFSQSFRHQDDLERRVRILQASNVAQLEANRIELGRLHEQLCQINLENDRRDGEAAYVKAQPVLLERATRVAAEWEFVKSRKFAFRMKQPYKEYTTNGFSAENTMAAFLTSFCDRCWKSYSASEDHFACQQCFGSDRKLWDAQSGRYFDLNINVCRSCIDKGKGCFFHGQGGLEVTPEWKKAFSVLRDCPRYNVDQMAFLHCDNCSKDMRDDSSIFIVVRVTRITIFVFSAGEKKELHVSTGTMIYTSSPNALQVWLYQLELLLCKRIGRIMRNGRLCSESDVT